MTAGRGRRREGMPAAPLSGLLLSRRSPSQTRPVGATKTRYTRGWRLQSTAALALSRSVALSIVPPDEPPPVRIAMPEPYLYHYTNATGLQGVLNAGRIWATSVQYLNDRSEVAGAFKLASAVVRSHAGWNDPSLQAGFERFIEYCRMDIQPNHLIVSFSEDPDVLSQWRAYGNYALGFSFSDLRTFAQARGWQLARCRYLDAEQRRVINLAISSALASFDASKRAGADPATFEDIVFKLLYARILKVAPLIKNSAFSEEREWRLCTVNPVDGRKLETRVGPYSLVPYCGFDLTANGALSALKEIHIGPSANQSLAMKGASALLASVEGRTGKKCGVERMSLSQTPYVP